MKTISDFSNSSEIRLLSDSEEETVKIAQGIADSLHPGQIIFLKGELGAGKTFFARAMAERLGVGVPVQSPSFSIVHEYPIENPRLSGIRMLFHLDLYRIDGIESALAFGIDEYLSPLDAVTIIEWPERLGAYSTNHPALLIEIRHASETSREFLVNFKKEFFAKSLRDKYDLGALAK